MNAVVSVAATIPMKFLDANGAGKEGLNVTASARKAGTTTTVSGTVTERSDGAYDAEITLTSVGVWLFHGATTIDGDAALWTETVQVITAAQADPAAAFSTDVAAIKTKTDRIGAAQIVATSPTAVAERITIRKGDTYSVALDRPLEWAYEGPTDLTDADSVTLVIRSRTVELTKLCTVEDAGEAVQTIIAELTGTQTDTLLQREVTTYDITALFGDDSVTLFEGKVTVQPDTSP